MAKPTVISNIDGIVTFSLSNKPEFEIKVSSEDYKMLIKDTTCYYVKHFYEYRKNKERKLKSTYIVRNIFHKCPSSGKQTCNTHFLHWDIVGTSFHWGDGLVVDHIDRQPMNNTRENLRIVTQLENVQNTSRVTNPLFSQKFGIKLPDYYNVAILKRGSGEFFQCYYKSEYVKGSTSIKTVVDAIEKHKKNINRRDNKRTIIRRRKVS